MIPVRRTKIIATLGPACSTDDVVYQLLTSGADVFRLNFSHGKQSDHVETIKRVRKIATELGRYIPIIGDIQGPKLRLGDVNGVHHLESGQPFVISTKPIETSSVCGDRMPASSRKLLRGSIRERTKMSAAFSLPVRFPLRRSPAR